jgi:hypothetical protein
VAVPSSSHRTPVKATRYAEIATGYQPAPCVSKQIRSRLRIAGVVSLNWTPVGMSIHTARGGNPCRGYSAGFRDEVCCPRLWSNRCPGSRSWLTVMLLQSLLALTYHVRLISQYHGRIPARYRNFYTNDALEKSNSCNCISSLDQRFPYASNIRNAKGA